MSNLVIYVVGDFSFQLSDQQRAGRLGVHRDMASHAGAPEGELSTLAAEMVSEGPPCSPRFMDDHELWHFVQLAALYAPDTSSSKRRWQLGPGLHAGDGGRPLYRQFILERCDARMGVTDCATRPGRG